MLNYTVQSRAVRSDHVASIGSWRPCRNTCGWTDDIVCFNNRRWFEALKLWGRYVLETERITSHRTSYKMSQQKQYALLLETDLQRSISGSKHCQGYTSCKKQIVHNVSAETICNTVRNRTATYWIRQCTISVLRDWKAEDRTQDLHRNTKLHGHTQSTLYCSLQFQVI